MAPQKGRIYLFLKKKISSVQKLYEGKYQYKNISLEVFAGDRCEEQEINLPKVRLFASNNPWTLVNENSRPASISVSTNAISLKLTINSVHDYKSCRSCACRDRDRGDLAATRPVWTQSGVRCAKKRKGKQMREHCNYIFRDKCEEKNGEKGNPHRLECERVFPGRYQDI